MASAQAPEHRSVRSRRLHVTTANRAAAGVENCNSVRPIEMQKRIIHSVLKEEPSLAEILSEPITQALMKADGVTTKDVEAILSNFRRSSGIAASYLPPSHDRLIKPRRRNESASSVPASAR
jgi:hypothetical protein